MRRSAPKRHLWIGRALDRLRERQGMSLAEMHRRTLAAAGLTENLLPYQTWQNYLRPKGRPRPGEVAHPKTATIPDDVACWTRQALSPVPSEDEVLEEAERERLRAAIEASKLLSADEKAKAVLILNGEIANAVRRRRGLA